MMMSSDVGQKFYADLKAQAEGHLSGKVHVKGLAYKGMHVYINIGKKR